MEKSPIKIYKQPPLNIFVGKFQRLKNIQELLKINYKWQEKCFIKSIQIKMDISQMKMYPHF